MNPTPNQRQSIQCYVKKQCETAESGHDWWHIFRVWKLAKRIAREENVNMLVVEAAALLHDIADEKFCDHKEKILFRVHEFLEELKIPGNDIDHIINIIRYSSFKKSFDKHTFHSPEMNVVMDADRLDAIGAIGIARAFSYGGYKQRPMYDPAEAPKTFKNSIEYLNSKASTINHFYEKLLLLKDTMKTSTGKKIAGQRHKFLEQFLEQFMQEWDGES